MNYRFYQNIIAIFFLGLLLDDMGLVYLTPLSGFVFCCDGVSEFKSKNTFWLITTGLAFGIILIAV